MDDYIEVCGGREKFSSEIIHACSCGIPVVFLCTDCVVSHLKEPFTHNFIPLDQAQLSYRSMNFNSKFRNDLSKYALLKSSIQQYVTTLHSYKEHLKISKIEVLTYINQEFQSKLDLLMDLQHKAILHLDTIKTRMKTSFRFGDEDLSRFEIEGLPGILDNYIQHFNIKTFGIRDTVRNIFSISYTAKLSNSLEEIKNSQNDILYYTQQNSRQLMTYDITTNQTRSLDLETSVQTGFNNSSACILPDGNIMIVGSFVPTHGETYKFNTQTGRCIQLKGLRYPRGLVGVICHDKYLYALGGCTTSQSKKAERMEWSGSGWKHLPDMNSARFYVGMICMNNRIYLIGGAKMSSVEYYDIRTNQFIAKNVQVPVGSNMAVVVDDRIYLLSTSRLVVMNREYEVNEIKTLSGMSIDSFNSPRIRGKKVYFHSGKGEFIVEFDTENRTFRDIIPTCY